MSSTLKRQLAALAAAPSSLLIPERRRASILFPPAEAAKYDKDAFYQIGQEGLDDLISLNPNLFGPFRHSLIFSEASKDLERAVEDTKTNEMLNEGIEDFLIAVSPYLMIKSTLKAVEWLVYRFHIEKFNIDSIVRCVLPYHDTKTFVLVIQILEIENYKTNREWKWLEPYVASAMAVPKAILFANANVNFVLWLFATLGKFVRVHYNNLSNLKVFIAFMTSTLIGVMIRLNRKVATKSLHNNNRKAVAAALIGQIEELLDAVANEESMQNNQEINAMIYILIAVLHMSLTENPDLKPVIGAKLRPICKYILKSHPLTQTTEAFLILNLLTIFLKSWHIASQRHLNKGLSGIALLSDEWDLFNIAYKLIISNASDETKLTPSSILNWMNQIQLSVEQRSEILREVYVVYVNSDDKKMQRWGKDFVLLFETQYPLEFGIACQFNNELAENFTKVKTGKNDGMLSQHPDANIRVKAVKSLLNRIFPSKLFKKNQKLNSKGLKVSKKKVLIPKKITLVPDKHPTAQLLMERFVDDNPLVVQAILKKKLACLQELFSTEILVEKLSTIVAKKASKKCVKLALKKLCSIAQALPSGEQKSKIFTLLVPLLFPRTSVRLEFSKLILKSDFSKNDDFLCEYLQVIEKDDLTPDELNQFSYELILKAMPKDLNFLEKFDLTTPIKTLFACLQASNDLHIDKIITAADRFPLSSTVGYPVTKDNFGKCVDIAERKHKLSLDMILTSIMRVEITNHQKIENIFKFIWKASEDIKSKDACFKFLQDFRKKCFTTEREEMKFWHYMLLQVCLKEDGADGEKLLRSEYWSLRTLQFVTAFIKTSDHTKSSKIVEVAPKVINLRNRVVKKGTPDKSQKLVGEVDFELWQILEICLARFISHTSSRIRLWSLNCIRSVKDRPMENDLKTFISQILDYEKEILADEEQGAAVIAGLLMENVYQGVLQKLMDSVLSNKSNPVIILGILNIFKYIGSQVFLQLVPFASELLDSYETDNEIIKAVFDCYDGSLEHIKVVIKALENKSTYRKITSKITRDIYENYSLLEKKTIFGIMVQTALDCQLPEIKVSIQRCVRKWFLDASIVSHELVKCIGMQKRNSTAPNSKSTPTANSKIMMALDAGWTKKTEVVLEFIQSKKNLKNKEKLIVPLFRILKTCIILEEQTPVEYLKQLVLTGLTICCQEDDNTTKPDADEWVHFNVELIIDCLRCSRNPQTHHHALILLNYAAKRFPEQVLHGIMSLFTFMGNSILRQDDTYSTQLIQQTVTSIIPTLAKTGRGNVRQVSTNLVSAGIFRVFTSAVQDIPVHRRLPVFKSLVETLDPVESMWQICIIIVDNALNRDKKRSNLNADLELATDLVWNFEPKIVLLTLEKIYTFLTSLPLYNRELSKDEFQQAKNTQDTTAKSILDISRKESLRDVQIVVLFTLELVSKVSSKFEHCEDSELQYDSLLGKCLTFSRLVSAIHEDKIFRLIAHRNFEVVEKLNSALDPTDFVRVVASILKRDSMNVKKKIMDMLNQRILQKIEWFKDAKILIDLLEPLSAIVLSIEPDSEENVILIQTAFLSLKLIAKNLAQSHPEEFTAVCDLTLSHATNKNRLMCSSALLCMGELFCLKSMILPNLKSVTTAILKAFKICSKQQQNDEESMDSDGKPIDQSEDHSYMTANLLCLSTMTCLNKLVEQLGSFIGAKFLQKALTAVLKIDGKFGFGEKAENRKKVFDQRLKTLLKSIAVKIPLRNSLMPIRGAFSDLAEHHKSISILMNLLKENLVATSKPDFAIIGGTVCDAFLDEFLPLREKLSDNLSEANGDRESIQNGHVNDLSGDDIDRVEDSVLDCLITGIILKMSEGHFRPFYHRIFDWAEDSLSRLVTFYRFSASCAERLKSLFTTFAGYVINKSVDNLSRDIKLTQSKLNFFYHIFYNDREGFITNDRFNSLIQPLVDLIESDFVISGQINIKDLNNTIVQLAVATNDLNRWQHLIELISYKSQHTNSAVRLFVISTLEAAANELGKDFLPLLPPAVPFLADLMGDDDPAVEAETQKMLLKLENIVGEPLQSYFTM